MSKQQKITEVQKPCAGTVISAVGKKAVVKLDQVNEEHTRDVIAINAVGAGEEDRVLVAKKEKMTSKRKMLVYLSPMILFLIGFGVGFLFDNEMAHFGLILGTYGISMLLMVMMKAKIESGSKYEYHIETIEIKAERPEPVKLKKKVSSEKTSAVEIKEIPEQSAEMPVAEEQPIQPIEESTTVSE